MQITKNQEFKQLIKNNHIRRKPADNNSNSSTNLQKLKVNVPSKRRISSENSDYFQNSLKNVVTYDKDSWNEQTFLSNKLVEKRFFCDFKNMRKKIQEAMSTVSFKKPEKIRIIQKSLCLEVNSIKKNILKEY